MPSRLGRNPRQSGYYKTALSPLHTTRASNIDKDLPIRLAQRFMCSTSSSGVGKASKQILEMEELKPTMTMELRRSSGRHAAGWLKTDAGL